MSKERFIYHKNYDCITDVETDIGYSNMALESLVGLLNALHEENEQLEKGKMEALSLLGEEIDKNEQLRTQLLICQQSKNDDGRFQVWEVPPITMGKRISFTTNNDGVDE